MMSKYKIMNLLFIRVYPVKYTVLQEESQTTNHSCAHTHTRSTQWQKRKKRDTEKKIAIHDIFILFACQKFCRGREITIKKSLFICHLAKYMALNKARIAIPIAYIPTERDSRGEKKNTNQIKIKWRKNKKQQQQQRKK